MVIRCGEQCQFRRGSSINMNSRRTVAYEPFPAVLGSFAQFGIRNTLLMLSHGSQSFGKWGLDV